uniref:hypothetical protein n=1 Tax=uncultured Acinetobacter sp. TaxID=165433 RepID=UPI002639C642|nr:hypothetical protein [uncultured Acinetobacter sp.]
MTDFNAAFTLFTALNIGEMSDVSGSAISQHIMCEPDHRSTGSLTVSPEWLILQTRSGQNIGIINNQKGSIEKKLDLIKFAFDMTDEDIAQRIDVGRKTLFNWKKQESSPNKEKVQAIFELYMLAKNWLEAGFSTEAFDLEAPVLAGKSIKDMLREPMLNSEQILFAGNRLNHKLLGEVSLF